MTEFIHTEFHTITLSGTGGLRSGKHLKRTNRNCTINSSGLSSMHENNISKQRNRNPAKTFPRETMRGW